jgi:hypothetical protein
MTDIYGYNTNSTFPNGINTNAVSALDATANIAIGQDTINLSADLVSVNGIPITGVGGFVTNPMSTPLNANDYDISNAGVILATSFVKNGGTSQQYLMGDGSALQYSANSGNSNFYLYDNGTDQDPTPQNGYITYNATEQKQATEIYISHRTRDNIDIEVFFRNLSTLNDVYIQDQSNSDNSITYNITGNPVIVNQAQVTIPVSYTASSGNGSISFGSNHNILLSFFTNSIETDERITTVESKTQLITANSQKTILSGGSQIKLNTIDSFQVSLDVGLDTIPKFTISGTQVSSLIPMNMSFQKLSGLPDPIDDDEAANKLYVDTEVSTISTDVTEVQERTQNISATLSGTTIDKNSSFVLRVADADFFVVRNDAGTSKLAVSNTSVQINSVPLFMQGQRIQLLATPVDVGDAATKDYVDNSAFVKPGTLTAGSVPYFTATNTLGGATKNFFVQLGNSTIQSAIDAATLGGATGGAVLVSSGGSTENVICPRQNYTLVGTICPPFTQTTQITGNLTIGSAAFLSTRVRVSHMKFVGNLVFDNSTNQQLRTYFYNCDWNGTITFPTSAATGANGTQIYFDSCSFSGASAIVIPNQSLYTIFFTRCSFIGQTITNQQVVGNTTKTIFNDCSYLPTLSSLGFCVLNGPNTTLTTTQANYGSLVLGGLSTQYLMGNGSLLTATYPTMTTGSFAVQWTGGAGGTTADRNISWRRLSDGTSTTVWLTLPTFTLTIGTASNFGILSTATVPANLQVAGQPHLPIIVNFNGIVQCGWLHHFGNTLGVQPSNKAATVVGQVCGIPNVAIVSYMI